MKRLISCIVTCRMRGKPLLVLLSVFLASCSNLKPLPMTLPTLTPTSLPSQRPTHTPTPTLTPTQTAAPTETPTVTPTPTPTLYVLAGTQLPAALAPLTSDTVRWISALATWQDQAVTDLAWTADGLILAVAGANGIHLYDLASRQVLRSLYPQAEGIVALAFSPDGRWLVAGSRLGSEKEGYFSSLELWQGPDWKPRGLVYNAGRALNSLSFSPDSKFMAAAFSSPVYEENSVEIWSSLAWTILASLQTGTALNAEFAPRGPLLAVTPDRYAIRVWDWVEEEWLYELRTSFTGAVTQIAFSPDGQTLASGHYDGSLRLWDMRTGEILWVVQVDEVIECLAFSPDGSLLASGGSYANSLVRLWDSASGTLIRDLMGHSSGVTHMTFSPDGQFLVSTSYDGQFLMWGIRP